MAVEELGLTDANILVYAVYPDNEHYAGSRALLERAERPDGRLCVTPQVLCEFFSTVTNPKRVSIARQPEEAVSVVEAIVAMPGMTVLPISETVPLRMAQLVRRRAVKGARIFDVQLVATMLENGIRRIYRFNRKDFDPLSDLIEVLTPVE